MADDIKADAAAAAEAPAKVAETIADAAQKVVKASADTAKKERVRARRRAKAVEATARPAKARRKAVRRTTRAAKAKPAAPRNERTNNVTFDPNTIFAGLNGTAPFQTLFAEAGERGQEAVKRSQKLAEELVDITRANVEALVEAGRVAAEGSRSIAQDVVAKSRENVEQAADVVRSLAEAKSPTEFIQLQSDFARAQFDRFVAESSRLTESMVKLAGEAIQPLSNRATANAERLNEIVA